MQAGVAQEPGRSRRLHRRCGTDGRDKQQSRPGERPTPAGANRAAAWYRQAKETKCGGTGVEKSESADSTVEVGEPAPRGPGGGKRRIGSWTVGRTDGLDTEPTAVSTQVRQLAERRRKRRRAGARFGVAMPWSEEPDARVGHVRICGSRGWETTLGHPARPVAGACTIPTPAIVAVHGGAHRADMQGTSVHRASVGRRALTARGAAFRDPVKSMTYVYVP